MDVRDHIIEQTTAMFVEYGVKSVRMDDIASRLGISKRTIYEIFGDKENLITECLDYYAAQIEKAKTEKLARAGNVIEEFLMIMKEWDKEIGSTYRIMTEVRKFYPKIYKSVSLRNAERGYAELRRKLEQGVTDGYLLDNINYDLAVSVFSYSIYGIVSSRDLKLPSNVSEIDAFRYVITYFFRGVSTEKGIKLIDEYLKEITKQNNL